MDERAEERLGALLNLYGATSQYPVTQRALLLTAAEYARKWVARAEAGRAGRVRCVLCRLQPAHAMGLHRMLALRTPVHTRVRTRPSHTPVHTPAHARQ